MIDYGMPKGFDYTYIDNLGINPRLEEGVVAILGDKLIPPKSPETTPGNTDQMTHCGSAIVELTGTNSTTACSRPLTQPKSPTTPFGHLSPQTSTTNY